MENEFKEEALNTENDIVKFEYNDLGTEIYVKEFHEINGEYETSSSSAINAESGIGKLGCNGLEPEINVKGFHEIKREYDAISLPALNTEQNNVKQESINCKTDECKIQKNERECDATISGKKSLQHSPNQSRSGSTGRRGVLHGQSRELVLKVRSYFEREKAFGGPLCSIDKSIERTCGATQISRRTIFRITNEKRRLEKGSNAGPSHLSTPGTKRKRISPVTEIQTLRAKGIRNHIYLYYQRRERPTLRKLVCSLKEDDLFIGSASSLSTVLEKLGFEFKSIRGKKMLIEKQDIVLWRCRFLREILNPQVNLQNVVWLNETWVSSYGHTLKKGTVPGPKDNSCRLLVLHAGTANGFVSGVAEVLHSSKDKDYPEEMDHLCFKKWFLKLLNNLDKGTLIVMDVTPYNSKVLDGAPTACNTKAHLIEWLSSHNIGIDSDLRKPELLDLVDQNKQKCPSYEIDELAALYGHKVLRLPLYHTHFNPIDLIWNNVKDYVARNSKTFTLPEMERLTKEGISRVTADDWRTAVEQTERILKEAWRLDGIIEEAVDELIIDLSTSSKSSKIEMDSEDSDQSS